MITHFQGVGLFIMHVIWRRLILIALLLAVGTIVAVNLFGRQSLPDDPVQRIHRLQAAHRYIEAERVYEQLLSTKPLDLDLNYQYIGNHFEVESTRSDDRFESRYTNLSVKPESADVGFYGLGLIKAYQKEFKAALDYYVRIKSQSQKYVNNSIGRAYFEIGEHENAVPFFRREINGNGYVEGAVYNLEELYLQRRDLNEIRALLQDARTGKFVSFDTQRRFAFMTGDLATYARLVFILPFQMIQIGSALMALLVCATYLMYLRRIDLFEPEPVWLMALALILGAVAALSSGFLSDGVGLFLNLRPNEHLQNDIPYYILQVGLVEEVAKFLPVLLIVLAFSREVNEPVDLIIYGSLSALGFATLENSLYLSAYGFDIALLRFVVSTLVHLAMTSLICFAWAQARFAQSHHTTWFVLGALLLAATLHGLFDAFLEDNLGIAGLLIALLLAYCLRRMVKRCLTQSRFYKTELSASDHLHNVALMLSTAIIILAITFLFDNYNYSTEIANSNLIAFTLVEVQPATAIFSLLGNINLTHKVKK